MRSASLLLAGVLALSGCASMQSPESSLLETTPVVKVGEARSVPEEHIVFIPANTYFPVVFSLRGSALNEDKSSTILASFKRDLYLYKYWASLDGKTWVNSHELMKVEPSGGFDKTGGRIEVKLDLFER